MPSTSLAPYVPRFAVQWLLDAPDSRWRTVEGSLALVDISGFTALTERLARRGKVGAEQMSDLLDVTMSALLECAYDEGGGLVKWGGDALLVLFDGADHAAHAVRAVHLMRERIATITRLPGRSEPIALHLSAGIHSGAIHFALVGDPVVHRELLIVGPAASEVARLESVASVDDILVSAPTARLTPEVVVAVPSSDAWRVIAAPVGAPTGVIMRPSLAEDELAPLLFPSIRQHVLTASDESEHRRITVGFVRFRGSDALLTNRGPDALTDALDSLLRAVQRAVTRHGVTLVESDVDVDGGRLLLVAGAPTSSDDDDERMLRAVRAIVDSDPALPVSVGVTHGRVFAGDFGPEFRRTYSVKGDAVNLAARLMMIASTGEIVATPEVVDAASSDFDVESIAPFHVKGKSEAIDAVRVGARQVTQLASRSSLSEGRLPPLVGRDRELGVIRSVIDAAARGVGGLVVIAGEPGMGKSRLVDDAMRHADAATLLVRCEPYEVATPYWPWRSIMQWAIGLSNAAAPDDQVTTLREVVNARAPHLEAWLPLIGDVLNLELPVTPEVGALADEFRRDVRERAVVDLLAATLVTPTVIGFDDVHHMDDASASLLHAVVRRVASQPWAVLVTRRDTPEGFVADRDEGVIEVRPSRLTSAMARTLVRELTDDSPLTPTDVAAVVARADGNPLFLTGLLRSLGDGSHGDSLPETVEAMLTSAIDTLAPTRRRVLRTAAVLGMAFTTEQLGELLQISVDDEVIAPLDAFLRRDGQRRWRFAHQLVRDTAYEGLPYRRRRQLHARAGELLETAVVDPTEVAEVLSLHFLHAGQARKAWTYATVAGSRAADKYAYASAEELYSRALAAGSRLRDLSDRERADVQIALGEAQRRIGRADAALTSFRHARQRLHGAPAVQAAVLAREASVHRRLGHYASAMRSAGRGLALVRDRDDHDSTQVRSELSMICSGVRAHQGRHREALMWARRAEHDAQLAGDAEADAHAAAMIHVTLLMLGTPDRRYGERALRQYEAAGDRLRQSEALNNLALLSWTEGRGNEALAEFRHAHVLATEAGDGFQAAATATNIADVLWRLGRVGEAEAQVLDVLPDLRALRAETFEAIARRVWGLALVERGEVVEGREEIAVARRLQVALGEPDEVAETDAADAWALIALGNFPEAAALAHDAADRAVEVDATHLLPLILRVEGVALLESGEVDRASDVLQRAYEVAEEQASVERGCLLNELARIAVMRGAVAEADGLRNRAQEAWSELGFVGTARYPRT